MLYKITFTTYVISLSYYNLLLFPFREKMFNLTIPSDKQMQTLNYLICQCCQFWLSLKAASKLISVNLV